MAEFKKPNNSKNGELQPYNPENGEYQQKESNKENEIMNEEKKGVISDSEAIANFHLRMLGGTRKDFPLKFPKNDFPIEYKHYYFNNEINWNDIEVKDGKITFLIRENDKNRYLIFKNLLGYNEENAYLLKQQILNNASKNEVFVQKKFDLYGFRAKIYMPIKFANSDKFLIIKTCWVIEENKKPRLATAWYERNYERGLKDEI